MNKIRNKTQTQLKQASSIFKKALLKIFKLRLDRFVAIVTIFLMLFVFSLSSPQKSTAFMPITDPNRRAAYDQFAQCMGPALAEYLLAILNAQQSGVIGDQANILSPTFNMTSDTFGALYQQLAPVLNHPNLAGVSGNIYNTSSLDTLSSYIQNQGIANLGYPIYIMETGVGPTNTTGTNQQVIDELVRVFNDYPNVIKGVALFNPTGSNPSFPNHTWTNEELNNLCSALGNCNKIGINYGTYFSGNNYQDASQYGMGFVVQIAESTTNIQTLANSIDSYNGDVVIRIGTGDGAGGFENVQDYINFIAQLTVALDAMGSTADFFVLGGPNEPDLEHWLNPTCTAFILDHMLAGICNNEPNWAPVNYRPEVIGHNGSKPWLLASNITDTVDADGGGDLDDIVDGLQADFIIRVPKYLHDDFEIITDQGIGATEANSDTGYLTRLDKKIFSLPLFNSVMPGTYIPASYGVGTEKSYNPAVTGEEPKAYLNRILKTTPDTKDGEEFGKPAEMPNIQIKACLQRANCDPKREKCLRAIPNPADPYCGDGDDPNMCVGLGKTFMMTGHISQEEPTDLNAISRAYGLMKNMYVDQGTAPLTYNRLFSASDLRAGLAYASPQKTEIDKWTYVPEEYKNQLAKANAASQATTSGAKQSNPLAPTAANAATMPGMEQPTGVMGVNITDNGNGSVSIFYSFCIWASPGSACNIRDVNGVINGVEIFSMSDARILGESAANAYCYQPGWGNAPEVNVSLPPGQCTVISASARGGRVGPEGCNDSVSQNCKICREASGEITRDCGFIPPPPPVDCRDCPSWAPAKLCTPINAQKILNETECSDGQCSTEKVDLEKDLNWKVDGSYNGYRLDYQDQQNNNTPWYQSLQIWINEFLGLVGQKCDVDEQFVPGDEDGNGQIDDGEGGNIVTGATCYFGAKDYFLYAWPMSYEGDYKEKSVDMGVNNALFRMNGKNDQYFIPKSTTQPITMKLTITNEAALGGDTLEYKIPTGNQSWDVFNWFPDDSDSFYIGIRGETTRIMYLEYFEFFQPQISGYCMKQRSLSMPIEGRSVPEADNPICGYQNFWSQGLTYNVNHDRDMASANQLKGSPAALYATNNSNFDYAYDYQSTPLQKTKVQASIELDSQLAPIVKEMANNDIKTRYQNSSKLQTLSIREWERLIDNYYREYSIIFKKYSAKYNSNVLNDQKKWPADFAKEIEALSKRYVIKYDLQSSIKTTAKTNLN